MSKNKFDKISVKKRPIFLSKINLFFLNIAKIECKIFFKWHR